MDFDGVAIARADRLDLVACILVGQPLTIRIPDSIVHCAFDVWPFRIAPLEIDHNLFTYFGDKAESLTSSGIRLSQSQPRSHHRFILLGLPVKLYADPAEVAWVFVIPDPCAAGCGGRIDVAVHIGWVIAARRYSGEAVAVCLVLVKGVCQPNDQNFVLQDGALLSRRVVRDVIVFDNQFAADLEP